MMSTCKFCVVELGPVLADMVMYEWMVHSERHATCRIVIVVVVPCCALFVTGPYRIVAAGQPGSRAVEQSSC